MSKIFDTQLRGIFDRINAQEEQFEMASRLLAQAIMTEGEIYIKSFDEANFFNDYLLNSQEKLPKSKYYQGEHLTSADRIVVIAPHYTDQVHEMIANIEEASIDYVLICNKSSEMIDSIMHFIDLKTSRAIVPNESYEKFITPHLMAINYVYYKLYILLEEMGCIDLNDYSSSERR